VEQRRLVPVILLSGHFTRGEDKAEGLEGGGDVYFTKPVDPLELLGQIKALRRIREAELVLQQQAKIIDQIHDSVIVTDLAGRVTRWNKGAERIFGYTAAEMLERHVAVLYPPGEGEQAFRDILTALREKGSLEREKHVRRKSGEDIFVHTSFALLHDGHGEAIGIVGNSIDLTERRRLEEQIRQAQRMEAVGQLAGGLAHDFNNLMTVVTGFAEIVLESLPPGNPQRPLVQEIKKAGDRTARLTQQLLAFSRKQMLQFQVLDLNALVRDMQQTLQQTVGLGVSVALHLDSQLGHVKLDPGQFRQAILNLAAHARDAMPNGGDLTVATRNIELGEGNASPHPEVEPGSYALLTISDTGVGMDAATSARIFEPFFTTDREVAGNRGLGLATAYGIVKQSGGHLEVESKVGAGETFKVYLPRCNERQLRS